MMSLVVRKLSPEVVRPAPEPVMSTEKINLSDYDLYFVGEHSTALLVYPHPIQNPAGTIKRGLSQALLHYYPFSGRLHTSGGEVHISCTGEGVLFVAASANGAIKDANQSLVTRPLLDQLAVYPAEGCGDADPLLMMQVTQFSCGGFVVGVTWSHAVADGVGMGQFMQAVGELSRGLLSPSVVPVRLDDSLAAVTSSNREATKQFGRSLQKTDNALLEMTIPWSFIKRVKDKFLGSSSNGRHCTEFEVVISALWQCRTRAVISDPKAPALLFFTADARRHARAKEGYYGNCLTAQIVVEERQKVANANLIDLVKMIQRVKDQIPDKFSKDQRAKDKIDPKLDQMGSLIGYNTFGVTCWRKIGLECTDFGGGMPTRVMSYTQHKLGLPNCFITSSGEQGCCVLSACVKDEHADAFLAELAKIN